MTPERTLSQLSREDFLEHPAWQSVGDYAEDDDARVTPLTLKDGMVPEDVGEVWCLCDVSFADQSRHLGSAMFRGDSDDGPLLWSILAGEEFVPVLVPPAPPFVLAEDGPEPFSRRFKKNVTDVFPMRIEARPRFVREPTVRAVTITTSGVVT